MLMSIHKDFVMWTQNEPNIHWIALWKKTLSPSKCAEFTPLMITNIRNQHSSMNVRKDFSLSLSLSLFIYKYMIYNYVIYGIAVAVQWSCSVVSNSLQSYGLGAHQVPLSMGFSRQECWSGLPCPPPGDLPDSEIEPASLTSPALARARVHTHTHIYRRANVLSLSLSFSLSLYIYTHIYIYPFFLDFLPI